MFSLPWAVQMWEDSFPHVSARGKVSPDVTSVLALPNQVVAWSEEGRGRGSIHFQAQQARRQNTWANAIVKTGGFPDLFQCGKPGKRVPSPNGALGKISGGWKSCRAHPYLVG